MDKTINNNFEKLNAHKCQVCGLGNIENEYDICEYCGWEADNLQVKQPNLMGGANKMSLNQYKQFWEENKKEILSADDCLKTAVDLADTRINIKLFISLLTIGYLMPFTKNQNKQWKSWINIMRY